jgi:hypothetical protein
MLGLVGVGVGVVVVVTLAVAEAYTSGIPPVNRRALAGLWKLTPSIVSMKEFTVHPRKPPKPQEEAVLLRLKEDGSFSRYEDSTPETPTDALFKGTWDFRDGELILAADREEQPKGDASAKTSSSSSSSLFGKKGKDTILVGVVVATRHIQQAIVVPMGSVQVGKFFYPKNHPSFFDQPIFQPKRFGTFQLTQVLGYHHHLPKDEQEQKIVEKFRNVDFHNKKFFLTSSPIEPRRPKGNLRWSIKYNKYVGTYIRLCIPILHYTA